ncbi:MAG TPA: hypothetical protein VN018_10050 [Brevundimonas sp.]|nr:hypothetical protein [Brevundimonas sp.]
MHRRDHTPDAEALFARFAKRHGLTYAVQTGAPVEVMWLFPRQDGLNLPITLGLQNGDELNFGVADFWSHIFPFGAVADDFETLLDAWVTGDARIQVLGGRHRILQRRNGDRWETVYRANPPLLPLSQRVREVIVNRGDGA